MVEGKRISTRSGLEVFADWLCDSLTVFEPVPCGASLAAQHARNIFLTGSFKCDGVMCQEAADDATDFLGDLLPG